MLSADCGVFLDNIPQGKEIKMLNIINIGISNGESFQIFAEDKSTTEYITYNGTQNSKAYDDNWKGLDILSLTKQNKVKSCCILTGIYPLLIRFLGEITLLNSE